MKKTKYAKRNVPAGVLMLIYGIFMVVFVLFSNNTNGGALFVLNVLLGLSMIIWAVTLLLGKRNVLPGIGAVVLAVVAVLPEIISLTDSYNVSALSVVIALFWILAFLFLPFVMFGGILPQLEGLQKMAKTLWFLPALFMAANTGIDFIFSLISIVRYSAYLDSATVIGVLIGATIRAVLWILSLLFACQWAIMSVEIQKNISTHPQTTQQPQVQSYQQPQYQNFQPNPGLPQDPTEILRRYKGLLDDGIISREEYEAKKRQLLG